MSDLSAFRSRLAERRSQARLLDIGIPGVSQHWRPLRQRRTAVRVLFFGAAVVCSLIGLVVGLGKPTTAVTVTAGTYTVGGAVLHERTPGHYTGDGALVIEPRAQGVVAAASDASTGGAAESGVCFLSTAQRQERCVFVIDGGSLSAVDSWTGSGWSRRYDDGETVNVPASAMAPVPFAVGR